MKDKKVILLFVTTYGKQPEYGDLVKSGRGWIGIFGKHENSYPDECVIIQPALCEYGDIESEVDIIVDTTQLPDYFIQNIIDGKYKQSDIFTVKMEECYDFEVGDKLTVNKDLFELKKGEKITVKSFNHRYDNKVIEFEEDDKLNMGIHVSHLEHKTVWQPVLHEGKAIINPSIERDYSHEEVKKLLKIALLDSYDRFNYGTDEQIEARVEGYIDGFLQSYEEAPDK